MAKKVTSVETIEVNGLTFKRVGTNGNYPHYRSKEISLWSNPKGTFWYVVDPVAGRFSEKLIRGKTPREALTKAYDKLFKTWQVKAAGYGFSLCVVNLSNKKGKK